MPEAQSPTKPHSAFRIVALVMSGLVTVWFVFTTIVVFRYGDRIRDFGWTADGLVVRSVATSGPAAGRLRPGDVIAAFQWRSPGGAGRSRKLSVFCAAGRELLVD